MNVWTVELLCLPIPNAQAEGNRMASARAASLQAGLVNIQAPIWPTGFFFAHTDITWN